MQPKVRFYVYSAFVIGFVVLAPLLVLRTAGYRYNFLAGKVIQTSVLTVETTPNAASVYLDDELLNGRSDTSFNNIPVGEHTVRVERDGFFPWKKRLAFFNNSTTFATGISLLRRTEPLRIASNAQPQTIETQPWQGDARIRIEKTDSHTIVSRTKETGSDILAYIRPGDYEVVSSPSRYVLVADTVRERIILTDAQASNTPVLLNASAGMWQWDHIGNRLLYTDGYTLELYDPLTNRVETISRVSEPIVGIAWHPRDRMLFFAQNEHVSAIDLDDRDGREMYRLVETSGIVSLHVSAANKLLYFETTEDGADERAHWSYAF